VFQHNRRHEEGLLNGADPDGPRTDWMYFARYSESGEDESLSGQWVTPWTGTEYYVAATMIAEGLVDEGLAVARDVYERSVAFGLLYNHMECGEHYFRALAAWAMLPALQGLQYDALAHRLRFAPRYQAHDHDSILLLPGAWGRVAQQRQSGGQITRISVLEGSLAAQEFIITAPPAGASPKSAELRICGAVVEASGSVEGEDLVIRAAQVHRLADGAAASIHVSW
jgi:hypothetical protein